MIETPDFRPYDIRQLCPDLSALPQGDALLERISRLREAAREVRSAAMQHRYTLKLTSVANLLDLLVQIGVVVMLATTGNWVSFWQAAIAWLIAIPLLVLALLWNFYNLVMLNQFRELMKQRRIGGSAYQDELKQLYTRGLVETVIGSIHPLSASYRFRSPFWKFIYGIQRPDNARRELLMHTHYDTRSWLNRHVERWPAWLAPVLHILQFLASASIGWLLWKILPANVFQYLLAGLGTALLATVIRTRSHWRVTFAVFMDYLLTGLDFYEARGSLVLSQEDLAWRLGHDEYDDEEDEFDDLD
ncbi:hypothetical protein KDL29_04945 [bacterium]|nr:hypothetical protein [bacterium]